MAELLNNVAANGCLWVPVFWAVFVPGHTGHSTCRRHQPTPFLPVPPIMLLHAAHPTPTGSHLPSLQQPFCQDAWDAPLFYRRRALFSLSRVGPTVAQLGRASNGSLNHSAPLPLTTSTTATIAYVARVLRADRGICPYGLPAKLSCNTGCWAGLVGTPNRRGWPKVLPDVAVLHAHLAKLFGCGRPPCPSPPLSAVVSRLVLNMAVWAVCFWCIGKRCCQIRPSGLHVLGALAQGAAG